jgi:hypothetical protein
MATRDGYCVPVITAQPVEHSGRRYTLRPETIKASESKTPLKFKSYRPQDHPYMSQKSKKDIKSLGDFSTYRVNPCQPHRQLDAGLIARP